jgi:adenosine deaminase
MLRRDGRADRVIGLGMDSTERGVDPADFAPAYEVARAGGLHVTGHAGEDTGPENIAAALEALQLERIDHGIAVVEDPALMERLAGARVPFNVCPSSNVVIANRYSSLAEHPLRRMRDAGLLVTINTDDPAMTGADLGREYRDVAEALGYGFDEMCRIAVEGIDATWLDDTDQRDLRRAFEETIAQLAGA